MLKVKTIIQPVAAAAFGDLQVNSRNPVTVMAQGLAEASTVDLQVSYNGTNFMDCYRDGTKVSLTATNNIMTIYGPGIFRFNKGITVGAVSCTCYMED